MRGRYSDVRHLRQVCASSQWAGVPQALRDLAFFSARINLQLKTNVESAQGYANFLESRSRGALDAFNARLEASAKNLAPELVQSLQRLSAIKSFYIPYDPFLALLCYNFASFSHFTPVRVEVT